MSEKSVAAALSAAAACLVQPAAGDRKAHSFLVNTYVYALSSPLGSLKVGVAADPLCFGVACGSKVGTGAGRCGGAPTPRRRR